ncbi:MAG: hypothetical protein AAGB24_12865 [Bacteroidota bacterium]
MKSIQKIQAGALQFVLFIGAIIAILLFSFVLVSYSHNLFRKKTDILVQVIQATDFGLTASFAKGMRLGETMAVPFSDDLNITTVTRKSYWGILEMRHTKATKEQLAFEKWAFVGTASKEGHALYLQDNQRPLVLAGKTKITGDAHLPEQGVKMGNIYGHSYYAPQLIYGEEKRSSAQLPLFHRELGQQMEKWTSHTNEPEGEPLLYENGMVAKNSFKAPVKVIKGSHISLGKVELSGNIIVWATEKIEVGAFTKLHDILLVAPEIEIANWTKGNLQALASRSISVGKGCELAYPSVLLVHQKNQTLSEIPENSPNITIDAYATVRGMVIYCGDNGAANVVTPQIHINGNAKVVGEVFCAGNLELKGRVNGSVTTGAFVALENGNVYQNHLYNGSIDRTVLPEEYAGLTYGNAPVNQVLKWLY